MNSLFDPQHNATTIERVRAVRADSPAQWGKMNAGQMMAHCQKPFEMAFGESDVRAGFLMRMVGRVFRKGVLSDEPFKKNLQSAKEFFAQGDVDFATEQERLIELIQRFGGGPAGVADRPHPFFGPMNPSEWDHLMAKHLDHHLNQFGV